MNRLNKFAFSKKLNKIIQEEAEKERIRVKLTKNNGIFEEERKTYYYKDGKVQQVDDEVRDKLKSSQLVDKTIKNQDVKQVLPLFILSAFLAVTITMLIKRNIIVKDQKQFQNEQTDYQVNYKQAIVDQAAYEQKQKDDKLQQFRENENKDMAEDRKSKDFK